MTANNNIGRNDQCPCGSGVKYKKCCMTKTHENIAEPDFSLSTILECIDFGLRQLDILADDLRKVNVKIIKTLSLNTVECQIYPYNENSADIKLEIGTIMGFLHGFFKDGSFSKTIDVKYFAVRAFDESDSEILYAISSYETAGMISKGNSIDWLKSTIFQENTLDYRLGIAKRQISEIEKAIRIAIVDILSKKHGDSWWNKSVGNKLSNTIKNRYKEQFGEEIEDGEILIQYSFLLQLKKIICTNWKDFKHLFSSKNGFEDNMGELNEIRKEEAHNREITTQHIESLNLIYNSILLNISTVYPKIIPGYLVDNWKLSIQKVMSNKYEPLYKEDLTKEKDLKLKLIKSTFSIKHLIKYIEDVETKLNSILVPIQKRKIHDKLISTFTNYRKFQEQLIEYATLGDADAMEDTNEKIAKYKKEMDAFLHEFLINEG